MPVSSFTTFAACAVLSIVLAAILVYACHRNNYSNIVAAIRSTISHGNIDSGLTSRLLNNLDPDGGCDLPPPPQPMQWHENNLVSNQAASNQANSNQQPQQGLLLAVFDQPAVQNTVSGIRRPRPPPSDVGYSSSMPNDDSATEDSLSVSIAPPRGVDIFAPAQQQTPSPQRTMHTGRQQQNFIDCL